MKNKRKKYVQIMW